MTQVASVYAQGLYTLAREEGLEEELLQQLNVLQESFQEAPEFIKLLSSHNISKSERCCVLDDSFLGKVHPYVLNFLKILTEKGYIRHFSDCCDAYREQYNHEHGILVVKAASAVELTGEQKQKLCKKLALRTGKKIDLQCKVDPTLLGGVRLDYDGCRMDGTVKNRLEDLSKLLKNTVL